MTAKRVALISVLLLMLASISAHIYSHGSDQLSGIVAFFNHLFDVIFCLTISSMLLVIGYGVLTRLDLTLNTTAESLSFSFALGTGIVGLCVLGLGLVGLLTPLPVFGLLTLGTLITIRRAADLPGRLQNAFRYIISNRERRILTWHAVGVLLVFSLRAATPPVTADELIYHLPAIANFLEHGRVYPLFDNSHGNFPFLINMIYAVFMLGRSDVAARLFSLVFAVMTALSLYGFAVRFLTRRTGVIALFSFFAAGMVVEVATTARIDVSLAGMLFFATYAMMNFLQTNKVGWLWLSGIFAGFSLGVKQSAAVWLLLIGVMYLFESLYRKRESISRVVRLGVIYSFIALVIACPWYIKNYVWFHNPFYPLFTGEVAELPPAPIRFFNNSDEQKLDAFFDTTKESIPETVASQEAELQAWKNARPNRHPLWLWDYFVRPDNYYLGDPYHFPNYLFLLIPLVGFVKANRWVNWLLICAIVFIIIVATQTWIARFLLPAYPALTIVFASTVDRLSARFPKRERIIRRGTVYLVSFLLGLSVGISIIWIHYLGTLSYICGRVSRHDYLVKQTYYKPLDYINTNLPSDARILMIGFQTSYGIKRSCSPDETWFANKWRRLLIKSESYADVSRELKQENYTHIVYSAELFKLAAMEGVQGAGAMDLMFKPSVSTTPESVRLGPEYQLLRNWATFTDFQNRYLETVYSDKAGIQILRIK